MCRDTPNPTTSFTMRALHTLRTLRTSLLAGSPAPAETALHTPNAGQRRPTSRAQLSTCRGLPQPTAANRSQPQPTAANHSQPQLLDRRHRSCLIDDFAHGGILPLKRIQFKRGPGFGTGVVVHDDIIKCVHRHCSVKKVQNMRFETGQHRTITRISQALKPQHHRWRSVA